MIHRKKLSEKETRLVVKAISSHLTSLRNLLSFFDERDEAEQTTKTEIEVLVQSINLKMVALMCTKNIPSDPAPVPSPTLSEECQEKR